MNQTSRRNLFFLAVISIVHLVFYLLALRCERIFNGDSFEYILEAVNIKDHFFFYSGNAALPIEDEYKTLRTPGYPFFLLLTYIFSINNWVVLLLQNLISIWNITYIRKGIIELGYNIKYDWLLLLFIVFFPSQFIYANTIAPDLLLQTFVLIYFRNTICFLKTKQTKYLIYMAIALSIGLFVKPVLYPFAFVQVIALAMYSAILKHNVRKTLLIALLPVVCILLYNSWNYTRTGKFHFTSIQSFNALYYYHNYISAKEGSAAGKAFMETERSAISKLSQFKESYNYAQQRGVELLRRQFVPYLAYHLRMSGRFFLETGRGELDLFTGQLTLGELYENKSKGFKEELAENGISGVTEYLRRNTSVIIALVVLLFNLVKLAGLVLFIFYSRQQRVVKWFLILLITYFALITGPISNAHYVLPVSLIIVGCACIGYQALLAKKNNKGIITS
jgi:hypothetical protein